MNWTWVPTKWDEGCKCKFLEELAPGEDGQNEKKFDAIESILQHTMDEHMLLRAEKRLKLKENIRVILIAKHASTDYEVSVADCDILELQNDICKLQAVVEISRLKMKKPDLVWATFVCIDELLRVLCNILNIDEWHPCENIMNILLRQGSGAWAWHHLQIFDHPYPTSYLVAHLVAVLKQNPHWRQAIAFCLTASVLWTNDRTKRKINNTAQDVDGALLMIQRVHFQFLLPFDIRRDCRWPTQGFKWDQLSQFVPHKPASLNSELSMIAYTNPKIIEALEEVLCMDKPDMDKPNIETVAKYLCGRSPKFKELGVEKLKTLISKDWVKEILSSPFLGICL